ncbi:MAG: hypothetical protein AAFY08_04825 [Planctomycetota bacterium]
MRSLLGLAAVAFAAESTQASEASRFGGLKLDRYAQAMGLDRSSVAVEIGGAAPPGITLDEVTAEEAMSLALRMHPQPTPRDFLCIDEAIDPSERAFVIDFDNQHPLQFLLHFKTSAAWSAPERAIYGRLSAAGAPATD